MPVNQQPANNEPRLPFFKAEHISKKGTTQIMVIGNCRVQNSDYGLRILFDVKLPNDHQYTWSLKPTNPTFRVVFDKLSTGEEILVRVATWQNENYVEAVGANEPTQNPPHDRPKPFPRKG